VWLHLAIATWAFGHHDIPSYIVDPGNYVDVSDFESGDNQDAGDGDPGRGGVENEHSTDVESHPPPPRVTPSI